MCLFHLKPRRYESKQTAAHPAFRKQGCQKTQEALRVLRALFSAAAFRQVHHRTDQCGFRQYTGNSSGYQIHPFTLPPLVGYPGRSTGYVASAIRLETKNVENHPDYPEGI